MAMSKPASLPVSVAILVCAVVPGTIVAVVGSFLTWYDSSESDYSQKGMDVGGVGVAMLAIACLLATAAFVGLRGRPGWLLGLVFVLALVPAADAGNYVAQIERNTDAAIGEGLYLVLIGMGLAAAGSIISFLLARLAEPPAQEVGGAPAPLPEGEPPTPGQSEESSGY